MGCILPTMHCRSQHCWELLHPFAHHCQHARNNSQHCCANNVGSPSLVLSFFFFFFSFIICSVINLLLPHVSQQCTENPNPDFRIQKRILLSFWANPKTDHESVKSTLWVDSSDQIQIRIFEIHNLSVFFGKGFEKNILTSCFPNKNGTQQMLYIYDILTEPTMCWWRPNFELL